ncbi:hypothetical protein FisN_6Lh374 [Fistulifera solaris]|uniref:DNA replication complex GINS protein PSF3 N-terminal domain-containing protein n=1 Tax=Fistulifera solaris TaxID=1519565 RepID=A0A1Z5JKT4_FISSO|nr:hypothetical protein FisN_6Lh374 [Fistulifera solaris]|eukprot:GAX14594.1 hypothetical protein FisN_6Lh374 [Fistulifera solaris]
MQTKNYFDVDAILAEEELVPCQSNFDFSYLSHLDPDERPGKRHYLPEGTKFKVPVWAVEKWATLGFVKLSLPRHFGRKARERIEAGEADIRKRNERFFIAGKRLGDLLDNYTAHVEKAWRRSGDSDQRLLELIKRESAQLRRTLLSAYTGQRLSQTLNWALSSVGDDVTEYTKGLTELERRLFLLGATSASSHEAWKVYGNGRLLPVTEHKRTIRSVTPDLQAPGNKRQRIS